MSKSEKENKRAKCCSYYDKCHLRMHPLSATDSPNIVAHLGFRFLYTFLAWFVLGYNVNEGFFVAMFFFVLPVFMDCVKFTSLIKLRQYIKIVEIAVTGLLLFISTLGIIGIYTIKNENNVWQIVSKNFVIDLPSEIGIEWIWGLLGLIVLVTAVDWLCNQTKIEGGWLS